MFSTIEEALKDLKEGKIIIVVDDEDRENEGDLVAIAEYATPQVINFMATHGRGLICMPIEASLAKKLDFKWMVPHNTESYTTAFTESIDAIGTTTGISAYERSMTILKVCHPQASPNDFKRPGHVFPLIAKSGGVLRRPGHTEAAVDLAKLAQCQPMGVICEIMNDDGTMARVPDLEIYAQKHQLKMITIADLIKHIKTLDQPDFFKQINRIQENKHTLMEEIK